MIVLGVESTAHTFGIGIITDRGKILANEIDSFSSKAGGMIPDQVADHHKEVAEEVLKKALEKANLTWNQINFIAYAAGPGLDPALWAGYHKAKEWSKKHNKELKGINHCCAHLSIGKKINNLRDPVYIYVSGVNTQIINFEGGKYRVIGETLDIGLGNMLDKLGRTLDLGFPAGPKIELLAKEGKYIELPYKVKGMDVDFSGIVTKATQLYNKGVPKEDLCFSFQETCFAMLVEVTERALAHCEKKEVLLIGGVAANKRFSDILDKMAKARKAKAYTVPFEYAGDQGAMIAYLGDVMYNSKNYKDTNDIDIDPRQRIDDIKTFWR